MTAAGLALIAGGLATLICFRSVLFGAGRRRGRGNRRRMTAELGARSVEPVLTPPVAPPAGMAPAGMAADAGRGGLATLGLADEPPFVPVDEPPFGPAEEPAFGPADDDVRELIAEAQEYEAQEYEAQEYEALGEEYAARVAQFAEPDVTDGAYGKLYDDEDLAVPAAERDEAAFERAAFDAPLADPDPLDRPLGRPAFDVPRFEGGPVRTDPVMVVETDEDVFAVEAPGLAPPTDQHLGHRIDGWVRPEYRHVPEEPPAGEYWTPIPVELDEDPEPSAKGYGWPRPVERLPAVPDYEPATGFDLAPVEHEPTEVVATWPAGADERPGRVRLPRNWAARNDKRRVEEPPAMREWRDDAAPVNTQLFAAVTEDLRPAARRRPRPRPRPTVTPPDRSTTVYVSRHAAEPPR